MIYAGATHKGCVRKNNEDSYYYPVGDGRAFVAVADGMGGHLAGEVASSVALETAAQCISEGDLRLPVMLLRAAAYKANETVHERSLTDEACANMGTTLTMALLESDAFTVAHVGDSRAYGFAKGELRLITRDHSLVEELVATGRLERKDAPNFPHRNVITRAVGTGALLDVDIFEDSWAEGDRLLICTDGLTTHVDDEEMGIMLAKKTPIASIVDELIGLALSRGGRDNITVVIVENTSGEVGR